MLTSCQMGERFWRGAPTCHGSGKPKATEASEQLCNYAVALSTLRLCLETAQVQMIPGLPLLLQVLQFPQKLSDRHQSGAVQLLAQMARDCRVIQVSA